MDLTDVFAVTKRVTEPKVMTKLVNKQLVTKQVAGRFNWLAFFFAAFYAVFSNKYRTRGFIAKLFVVLLILVLINCGLSYLFDGTDVLWNLIEAIYYGLMFDTWYYHQLLKKWLSGGRRYSNIKRF
ncbi:integral membrane protein [Lactiplantibacillus plantarum]|uniref:Integral membrane protein n=1 Tax=Lactiplantibacillus plantarum TaxID=1590 RepID=A0A165RA13_LACPN|nr:hypothetical protein [Lactiplantibacillus plantarum]KZU92996.1 integral membrane protein [Lactiplantibacillus plantarum]